MWSLTEGLLGSAIVIVIIYYLKFLWGRRYLYMHSMKIDGPLSLPIIGTLSFLCKSENVEKTMNHYFETYPGIFKTWHGTELVYSTAEPKYIEIILNHRKCLNKGRLADYARFVFRDGLFAAKAEKWRKTAKLVAPTFNQTILNTFVDVFVEKSNKLVTLLDKYATLKKNFPTAIIHKTSLDMICATFMGVAETDPRSAYEFGASVKKLLHIGVAKFFIAVYRWQCIFNVPLHFVMKLCYEKINEFTEKLIEMKTMSVKNKINIRSNNNSNPEVVETELQKTKFLDYLLEMNNDGKENSSKKFTNEDLRDEVVNIIVAGSDSTSLTSCFLMLVLGLHQDVQQKVFDEVVSVCGLHRDVEVADLHLLKYTEMVMKETMRIFTAVPYIIKEASADIYLSKDIIIPEGAMIAIGLTQVHSNPAYWPNPKEFIPERFLPEEVAKRQPYTFLPFSKGPRSCLGRKYAMMAIKTVIASVIRKHRIFTDYKSIDEIELKNALTCTPKNGYKLRLQHRTLKENFQN